MRSVGTGGVVPVDSPLRAAAGPPRCAAVGPPRGATAGPPRGAAAGPPRGAAVGLAPAAALGLALAAALGLVLGGCAEPRYEVKYDFTVTEAIIEENAPEDAPGVSTIALKAEWKIQSFALSGLFSNPADTAAVILWESATFAVKGSEPEPLLSLAPFSAPDLPQSPTPIARRGQLAVDMLPRSKAEWSWFANRGTGGSWHPTTGLLGMVLSTDQSAEERQSAADGAIGRRFTVRIPVRTGRRQVVHLYEFRITGAEVVASYH